MLKKRKKYINYESDHLTLLNIFNAYKSIKSKKEAVAFAKEHYFNDKSLFKAIQIQEQIIDYLHQILKKRA